MLSKMKGDTPLGSRIAEVHNGSSLFTGDAGQGESNIRRWIIENDWLEAIVALPLNMFYNTGIATYVWVLTNRKPDHRKGYVQLIDATQWYTPLRRNLGQKNCELSSGGHPEDLRHLHRLRGNRAVKDIPERSLRLLESHCGAAAQNRRNRPREGPLRQGDQGTEGGPVRESESAPAIIKKVHGRDTTANPLNGLVRNHHQGPEPAVVEYEPDPELRDTEQIPLLHEGGINAFLEKEVLPYAPDAWYLPGQVKVGYEISFTRHFYKPKPMRTLEEIRADILALEQETEGLLAEIVGR